MVFQQASQSCLLSLIRIVATPVPKNKTYRRVGRDDFRFFWNFITAFHILPCVIETQRYGYIRDSGGRVETPHGATIGCEKSYNG